MQVNLVYEKMMITQPFRLTVWKNTSLFTSFHFSNSNIDSKNFYTNAIRNHKFVPTLVKSWRLSKYIKRILFLNENDLVSLNGTLKLFCKVNLKSKPAHIESLPNSDKNYIKNEETKHRLKEFDDFEALLESGTYGDIVFIVEERKMRAHRAILVCRSLVFEEMLQLNTTENQENTLEIADIKYEVMKEVLRFIYVGRVNDIDRQAVDLLIAADKFHIPGLKALCETVLCESLSVDNAMEYLKLAATCNTIKLKGHIIEFFVRNLEEIAKKQDFEFFGALNSQLICEVVRAIAEKYRN